MTTITTTEALTIVDLASRINELIDRTSPVRVLEALASVARERAEVSKDCLGDQAFEAHQDCLRWQALEARCELLNDAWQR